MVAYDREMDFGNPTDRDDTGAQGPNPFAKVGLTYDDVLLLPGYSELAPGDLDTTTRLTREINIKTPLISAAMDTVTESRMAIAMARQGGIGVLHRNLSIEDQAYQVDLVKRTQTGMITNPVVIGPDATLDELDQRCGEYRVSGLPVVDGDNVLIGIITNRDLRFTPVAEWATTLVRDVMTPMPLITAPVGISHEDATLLLRQHKRERLPIVDDGGRLAGLITVKDFVKSEQFPHASKDGQGRLLVGAAIGYFGDAWERATTLIDAGVDVATGRATLAISGEDAADFQPTAATGIRGPGRHELRYSNCDNQLLLWVDGRLVSFDASTAYDERLRNHKAADGDLQPIGIASVGAALEISDLNVMRDIYYIALKETPYREHAHVDFDLEEDQFFVLGDNSAFSKDSRLWGHDNHYVPRELLIGKALFIYWPHSYDRIPYLDIPFPFFPNFKDMGFVR